MSTKIYQIIHLSIWYKAQKQVVSKKKWEKRVLLSLINQDRVHGWKKRDEKWKEMKWYFFEKNDIFTNYFITPEQSKLSNASVGSPLEFKWFPA